MLETIAIFLIVLGIVSFFTSYSIAGFIYALLLVSILVILVGVIKGKPKALSDKHS